MPQNGNITHMNAIFGIGHYSRSVSMEAGFLVILAAGVLSNCVFIVGLVKVGLRKKPSNFVLFSLAIGDFIKLVSTVVYLSANHVYLNLCICKLVLTVFFFAGFLILNTLLELTMERFLAVKYPIVFRSFASRRNTIIRCLLVWTVSALQTLFPVIRSEIVYVSMTTTFCNFMYLDVIIYVGILAVAIPVPAMLFMYSSFVWELTVKRCEFQNIQANSRTVSRVNSLKRPTFLVLSTFSMFTMCHAPIMYLIKLSEDLSLLDSENRAVWVKADVIFLAYTLHTVVTPILHVLFNREIHTALWKCTRWPRRRQLITHVEEVNDTPGANTLRSIQTDYI